MQGRLEVAASRSAASALILPPPPLPPGTFPGSNLTLGRGPWACDLQNPWDLGRTRNVPETHTVQNGCAAQPELVILDPPPGATAAPPSQSLFELEKEGGTYPQTTPPPSCLGRRLAGKLGRRLVFPVPWEFLSEQMKQPHQ